MSRAAPISSRTTNNQQAASAAMSSDLTFITNEQRKHLSDRFGVLLGDNTRFFDCLGIPRPSPGARAR